MDKWPALFAGEEGDNGIPELIIVGGIEVYDGRNGQLWDHSQTAPFVSVYAPSYLINCANNTGGMRDRLLTTGTSFGKLYLVMMNQDANGTSQPLHKSLEWLLTLLGSLL